MKRRFLLCKEKLAKKSIKKYLAKKKNFFIIGECRFL